MTETNPLEFDPIYIMPNGLRVFFCVAYYSVSFLSIVGNMLIIFVIAKNKKMHNVTNYFICNVAVADIIISSFSTPFQFHAAILQRWVWWPILCKLAPFATSLNINVSVLTLATISFDRFYVIFYPLKQKLRTKHSIAIMLFIWIFSLTVSGFNYYNYEVFLIQVNKSVDVEFICMPANEKYNQYYLFVQTIIQFILPLMVITFCFLAIFCKIYLKRSQPILFRRKSFYVARRDKNRKKVIKMIFIVLMVFCICWTPYQIYNLLSISYPIINYYKFINVIWVVINLIAMSSSCYSVFIYGIFSTKFKNEFNDLAVNLTRRRASMSNSIQFRSPQRVVSGHHNSTPVNGAIRISSCNASNGRSIGSVL